MEEINMIDQVVLTSTVFLFDFLVVLNDPSITLTDFMITLQILSDLPVNFDDPTLSLAKFSIVTLDNNFIVVVEED